MLDPTPSLPSGQPRLRLLRDEDPPPYDADHTPPPKREAFVMLPVDVLMDTDLTDKALRLYLVLLYHRNTKTGQCNPSRKLLAKELGCDVKTITKLCAELERFGLIERTMPTAGGVNHYIITLRKFAEGTQDGGDPLRANDTPPSAEITPRTIRKEQDEKEQGGDPPTPLKATWFPPAMLQFWEAFDAKGRERSSKKQVAAEWKKLRPDEATVNAIMAGVVAWKRSDGWQRGFAPGAHRFLNLEKWKELPEPARPGPPSSNGYHPQESQAEMFARMKAEALARAGIVKEGTEGFPDVIETKGEVR